MQSDSIISFFGQVKVKNIVLIQDKETELIFNWRTIGKTYIYVSVRFRLILVGWLKNYEEKKWSFFYQKKKGIIKEKLS